MIFNKSLFEFAKNLNTKFKEFYKSNLDINCSNELTKVQSEISNALKVTGHHAATFYSDIYSLEEIKYWKPVVNWIDGLRERKSFLDIGPAYGTLLLYAMKNVKLLMLMRSIKLNF